MAQLHTGTVTFLLTDIEDSSRLWERQPEAMRTVMVCTAKTLRSSRR